MRRTAVRRVFCIAVLCLATLPLRAAEDAAAQIKVIPGTTRATVGDRILVRVEVIVPKGATFQPPAPVAGEKPSLSLEPDTAPPGGETPPAKNLFYFRAQAFETGTVQIPGLSVAWTPAGGQQEIVTSEPIPVEIVSVLKGSGQDPADLKPPAEIAGPPFPWLWAALGAAVLAAVIALLVYLKRRQRAPPELAALPAAPALPPHELAYREMERLLASALLREGKIKQFHVELSEIVKRYLAARFGIEAMERTSWEVLEDLKAVRVGSEPQAVAREFLGGTDLVKFARYRPVEDEIRRSVDRAYRLVDLTKVVAVPPAAPPGGEPTAAIAGSAG